MYAKTTTADQRCQQATFFRPDLAWPDLQAKSGQLMFLIFFKSDQFYKFLLIYSPISMLYLIFFHLSNTITSFCTKNILKQKSIIINIFHTRTVKLTRVFGDISTSLHNQKIYKHNNKKQHLVRIITKS
jgi:hypothetical protein